MHIKTLEKESYTSGEFIDEYRLLVTLRLLKGDPPCVLLVDTEKDVGGGTFAQTLFRLPPSFSPARPPFLLLERGAHKPSPTEYLAPFYQDPAQRIAVLDIGDHFPYLAFPAEALLKLARDNEGCEIEWDGWKEHVIISPIHQRGVSETAWVSGCRLFHFGNGLNTPLEVYDFSTWGRVRLQTKQDSPDLGTVRYLQSTKLRPYPPWDPTKRYFMGGGRESIVFFQVSVPPLPDHKAERCVARRCLDESSPPGNGWPPHVDILIVPCVSR